MTIIFMSFVIYKKLWLFLIVSPFIIYPFAWSGHYFFENNSYSSLRDILKSPYFQIKMSNHEKNKLLERIVLHQKGNININIVNYKNKSCSDGEDNLMVGEFTTKFSI